MTERAARLRRVAVFRLLSEVLAGLPEGDRLRPAVPPHLASPPRSRPGTVLRRSAAA